MRKVLDIQWIILFCVVLHPFISVAQLSVPVATYLQTAFDDPMVQGQNNFVQEISAFNYDIPLTKGIDVRTETDRSDLNRQEFMIRWSLNGQAYRKTERARYEGVAKEASVQSNRYLAKALLAHYETYLHFYQTREIMNLLRQKRPLLQDQLLLSQKKVQLEGVEEADQWLKYLSAVDEINSLIEQKSLDSTFWHQAIYNRLPKGNSLSLSPILSIDKMEGFITYFQSLEDPKTTIAQLEKDNIKADIEAVEGKTKQVLDFVQIRYGGRNNLNPYQEVSLGVGLKIPYKGGEQAKLNALQLKTAQQDMEIIETKVDQNNNIASIQRQFRLLNNRRMAILKRQENNILVELQQALSQSPGVDPQVLIQMQQLTLDLQKERLELEHKIQFLFLEWIYESGFMMQTPLKDCLTEGGFPFEMN